MTFVRAIASDLVAKRLWPIAVLLAVALVGVSAAALLGGGSASIPTRGQGPAAPVGIAGAPTGAGAVAPALSQNYAVLESTAGASYQRAGRARDPFAAQATPKPVSGAPSTAGAGAAGHAASGVATGVPVSGKPVSGTPAAGKPASGAPAAGQPVSGTPAAGKPAKGGASPAPRPSSSPPAPLPRHSSKTAAYAVSLRFGQLPSQPGVPPQLPTLDNVARLLPLPSPTNPVLMFLGVRKQYRTASFLVNRPVVLHGSGACHPTPQKCQVVDLKAGQRVVIDQAPSPGSVVVTHFELDVVSIKVTHHTSGAAAARVRNRQSGAGRRILRQSAAPELSRLRFSTRLGVLLVRHDRPAVARQRTLLAIDALLPGRVAAGQLVP